MRARIEAGAGVSALFLAFAALATSQDWCRVIAIGLFALAGLSLLVAFANRLPLLHKCRLVGAPRLSATLKVDGRQESAFRVPKGEARTVLIELGIHNPARQDVQPARVNFLMSEGIKRWKCDHNGRPDLEGKWMRPTNEAIGVDDQHRYKDYWADTRTFPGDDDVVWWFRLRFKRPGNYRFRLKINSPVLYREFVQDFEVRVQELVGDPTTAEKLDAAIDEGEELIAAHDEIHTEDEYRTEYGAFVAGVAMVLPGEYRELYDDAEGDWTGQKSGKRYYREEAKAKVAVLCEIRRRLND